MAEPSLPPDTAYHGDPRHYDRSRALPPAVHAAIVAALVAALPPTGWVLDVGAGSGRFALPLAAQGYRVLALDASAEMLRHLQAKRPPGQTVPFPLLADAQAIPLAGEACAAALSVHTLHLVPDLPRAVANLRRVLPPHGLMALGYIAHHPHDPVGWVLQAWREALARHGYDLDRPLWRDMPAVEAALARAFGSPRTVVAARWQQPIAASQALQAVAQRMFTPYWGLPDPEHQAIVAELTAAARRFFPDLTTPQPDRRRFVWRFYRRPLTANRHPLTANC